MDHYIHTLESCTLNFAFSAISGKWKPYILWYLHSAPGGVCPGRGYRISGNRLLETAPPSRVNFREIRNPGVLSPDMQKAARKRTAGASEGGNL